MCITYGEHSKVADGHLQLALPPIGTQVLQEWWVSNQIERRGQQDGFHFTCFGPYLLAYGIFEESRDRLQAVTRQAYEEILTLARDCGRPHLIRIWNYIPDILGQLGDNTRYQVFCEGRRQAMNADAQTTHVPLPAVTATGSRRDGLVIYFLASSTLGQALENPRQTPPSAYPPHLGPHGPSFCRGVCHPLDAWRGLYLSGTASILGHETCHSGDARAQAEEILRNQAAVLQQAQQQGDYPNAVQALPYEKVYLANPDDYSIVRSVLDAATLPSYFVHSTLCREDLLMEMESSAL